MSFSFSIPTERPSEPLALTVNIGQMLFILGANGTGKSSLMQAFASVDQENKTRRITAHRQTWFRSGSPEFTGKQRADYEQNVIHHDRQISSRWMDDYSQQRAQMAIYDLVNSENVRAREIAKAVDAKNFSEVERLSTKDGAFATLNRLLRLANLDILVSVESGDEIMATRNGSLRYSIAKLSDGERNAILIAANVLTVPTGALLLIDEPERRLHRSIVAPLLSLLLKERPDCAFIVSTHEPLLPVDNPGSKILLTRACVYDGEYVTSYDIDLLENTDGIDDDLKKTILGERRKIVFVEGVESSLDKPLYSLLFPNASIVAKASCREVENAVVGIMGTTELHWVKPYGLVDNDSSEPKRIADLQTKGVTPLNVYSVESIYYHPEVQKLAGEKLAAVVGGDLAEKLDTANRGAIKAIKDNAARLSARIAEKSARTLIFSLLPKKGEVGAGGKRTVEIDFSEFAQNEAKHIEALINASDFVGILQRYPIRESPALDVIAKALNFANRAQYEAAVRNLLVQDVEAVNRIRSLLGSFPEDLIT
ncbi:AAA family ATPase [Pseudomonas congelans]|uniref:AAA family ATPase n=1 Tax=Pseudomonas congelans TaxID=200452 RepID=UPI001BDD05B9|nr:AAA family ATPase [Pseudomonas congelans]QVX10834.1 ATP-binding protein [Pseudomonas congelans]